MQLINEERRKIQNSALTAIKESNYNGIFLLPTGTGKSWVLIESLLQLLKENDYNKIWYLCNSTDLRDNDFPNELRKWGAEHLLDKINFMCYQTAYKLTNQDVDIVLADEFDYSLTPEYIKVYKNNKFKHKILTTAYIDSEKLSKAKEVAEIVYSTTLLNVEDKGVLNKSKYHFVNFMMTDSETKHYQSYNSSITALISEKNELMFNQLLDKEAKERKRKFIEYRLEIATRERKRFLNKLESSAFYCRKLMGDIYNSDKNCKILTFCELTKQADGVCKYTYYMGSDPDNLEKFRNDEIQALAVCGKINRGINVPGIKYIIFESCNQSKTQMVQRLGRGKRLKQEELLNVYFLIPHYYENGKIKSTKVKDWITTATSDLDLSDVILYRFKS